ncbi:hypothetical protein FGIG_00684 [Fasciola gigantica]|uniref:Uncharacterized protein n=1 Tax=Fasciola gigantica TaxID=46835 RepID=A0A504YCA9_FASGI|nr:hypothetical protein FGIG_00684 [Fasciola gigantica]
MQYTVVGQRLQHNNFHLISDRFYHRNRRLTPEQESHILKLMVTFRRSSETCEYARQKLIRNKQNKAKHYNIEGAGRGSIHRCDRRTSTRKCASKNHFVPLNHHLPVQFLFFILSSIWHSLRNGSIR